MFAQLQDKQVTSTQALPAAAGLQDFPLYLSLCGKERIGVLRLSSAFQWLGNQPCFPRQVELSLPQQELIWSTGFLSLSVDPF